MKQHLHSRLGSDQRGVATLVVVMILFFIISLVAAYTNRNLIFEQRTSANQYRSTQALEAAEAGVEWALAMLNHQRITASCLTSAAAGDASYRQRYIVPDPLTGNLTPKTKAAGGELSQICVLNGAQWDCSCPEDADPVVAAPAGGGVYPAFRVRFEQIGALPPVGPPSQPGVIRLRVVGCTRLDNTCLDFDGQGVTNEGRAAVSLLVALTGNLAAPPAAALLARGNIDFGGAAASVYNTDPAGSGVTAHAWGTIASAPPLVLHSVPGTPGDQSVVENDLALTLAAAPPFSTEDRMFASVFNMTPATFKDQPAAVLLACAGAGCWVGADELRTAITMNPGRPIWVQGDLKVDTAGPIGAALAPVLLVVEGDLTFPTAAPIYGLVYVRKANWVTSGVVDSQVQGAAVAEGSVSGNSTTTFVRDADVLARLRGSSGSFVRVPGSWKDFK
ncbi:MAG: pilus assembly PilX N-terminal domain-containing protein [Rubrivivax sp.]|nr:pilus assembly PilX N-terminal domain-containing protein [Rubrivivax sp.]